MGTNKTKIEKYLDLWKEFDDLLEKKNMTLSSFSKKWEEYHDNEESDYKKFYDNLKTMKKRSKKNKPFQNTINKLESYISFINDEYVKITILDDEKPEHWFDD